MKVRRETHCPIIGPGSCMSPTVLPRIIDVLRYYRHVDLELKSQGEHLTDRGCKARTVAREVIKLWEKSSIPTVSFDRVEKMVLAWWNRLIQMKSEGKRQRSEKRQEQSDNFKNVVLVKLLDIASCKCKGFEECRCPQDQKVPKAEQKFLVDQRTTRRMYIGNVDKKSSTQLAKRQKRRAAFVEMVKKRRRVNVEDAASSALAGSSSESAPADTSESECELAKSVKIRTQLKRDSVKSVPVPLMLPKSLSNFSRTCDRRGVSARCAAELSSSLMEDLGIVGPESKDAVVDKSKVCRERSKLRRSLQPAPAPSSAAATVARRPLEAVCFDGRKDKTLMIQKTQDGTNHRIETLEEHISMVEEPGSLYLGHFSVPSSKAVVVADSMGAELSQKGYNLQDLKVLGADGTRVNTGREGGVIRLMEIKLSKPLQWVICMLHLNELPLRHIFEHLDGPTSGPKSFSGKIGKALDKVPEAAVAKFKAIEHNLPDITVDDLSTDQLYLKRMCEAVSSGSCSESLANTYPGNLSHARWLTLANRLLRLYISTAKPSKNLRTLAEFIMKVYAPVWFLIKQHHRVVYAAKHFFRIIELCRYLPANLREVVHRTLQENSCMAHPESVLLAMLVDDKPEIREKAIQSIERARAESDPSKVRQFERPTVNFTATDYTDLVDWNNLKLSEPPLVASFSVPELRTLFTSTEENSLLSIPLHTQAVERVVKDVTDASKHVCGATARDGFIRARVLGRRIQPEFNTKRQYQTARQETVHHGVGVPYAIVSCDTEVQASLEEDFLKLNQGHPMEFHRGAATCAVWSSLVWPPSYSIMMNMMKRHRKLKLSTLPDTDPRMSRYRLMEGVPNMSRPSVNTGWKWLVMSVADR